MRKFISLGVGLFLTGIFLTSYASFFTPSADAQDVTCNPACGAGYDCVPVTPTGTATECVPTNPVCNPACPSGEYCAYSEGSQTQCLSDSFTTDSPITVTAPAAATTPTASGATFATLVNNIVSILNGSLVPLLYALAFLYFVVGVARFVFVEGQEAKQKGKDMMIYGLIGLVVIFGIWGIVNLLLKTLVFA